jgi:hypothetical protein
MFVPCIAGLCIEKPTKIDHPVQEYQVEVTENERSNMVQ